MRRIPALSLWRPYPTLILSGAKTVENRGWNTHHRGYMWIHAAKPWQGLDLQALEDLGVDTRRLWDPADHPTGIVGLVDLVDVCVPFRDCTCGPWAVRGEFHWKLANPRPLDMPVPCRGRQGLWYPTGEVAEALAATGVFADA